MSKVCKNMNDLAEEIASDDNGDIIVSKDMMVDLDDLFEKCRKYWCDDEKEEGRRIIKTIPVEDLIQEPNRICFATVSADGMIISWGKCDPGSPTEGLHIHIPREKMLELADAINKVRG